jgi:hypothetical protein
VTAFSLNWLPRWCPFCGNHTIIGHGQRRKQAHDEVHDVIRVRRGRCLARHRVHEIVVGLVLGVLTGVLLVRL